MSKNVPKTKIIEWKGLDRITEIVHRMNCIFRETSKDDVGLDGEIEVVAPKADGKGFETTGGIVKVQAKAGQSYVVADDGATFSTPVEKADLEYWHRCTFPVLFIVYHPGDDRLYFKEVKSYIQTTPAVFSPPYRIRFDKNADEFTDGQGSKVCEHARVSPPRIAFGQRERLFSNLLPVRRMPERLWYGTTQQTEWKAVRQQVEGLSPPFCVRDGRLYSLADLRNRQCVLRQWCGKRIKSVPVAEWIEDNARIGDFYFLLNQLLGAHRCLCGIRYNPDLGRAYFPRLNDTDAEFRRPWTSVRTGKAVPGRLIVKHYDYGAVSFWRHLAADLSFRRFGTKWYFQIGAKYLFTTDGATVCDSAIVGPYTTRLKADEHNPQVLNHALFWADVLSRNKSAIYLRWAKETIMVIDKTPLFGLTDFAIPDDPALYEEEPPPHPSLFDILRGDEEEDHDD
jgi:Domain of unknown function (DUF4365)